MPASSALSPPQDPELLGGRLMQRANNREGLPEIGSGVILLLNSGLLYALAIGLLGWRALVIALVLLFLVSRVVLGPLSNWVRRRYLIERSGYAQYQPMKRKYLAICVLIIVTAVLAGLFVALALSPRWIPVLAGLLWCWMQVLLGRALGLMRFIYVGAVGAIAGAVLTYASVPVVLAMAILIGTTGLASLASGGVTLLRFVKSPSAVGESDDR